MSATTINVSTDSALKAKAQSILADFGLDLPSAINGFLNQIVDKHAVPFEIRNSPTRRAKLGGWEGKIAMSCDFNEPMEEFEEYMK